MAKASRIPAISDASVPSAGRIYDYLLGGNHNFEIDRVAAEGLLKAVPEMPLWFRLIRWFLGVAIMRLANEGFSRFIDFASGLPTVDQIHEVAPMGTKVVYSDIDPITVAYGRKIVEGLPNVAFVQGDAASPESILRMPVVERFAGTDRRVAIGFNGIAWFLRDEQIAHALSVLYDWVGRGSKLFFCDGNNESQSARQLAQTEEFYKEVKEPLHIRREEETLRLFGKWTVCEPGLMPLEDWLPVDHRSIEDAEKTMGGMLVGAILEKV